MISLELDVHTFDQTVNQWLVKMAEGFKTLAECEKAEEAWRMSEDDYVKGVMNRLKEFMPKFYDIYATDCDKDDPWNRKTLDKMILLKQQKRQMKVEDAVRASLLGINSKANQVQSKKSPKSKQKRKAARDMELERAYAQGINDQSRHNYDNDSYYDQDKIVEEGQPSRGKWRKRGKGDEFKG